MLTSENLILVDCIFCSAIDADEHDYDYIMLLLLACGYENLAIVQELICAGADVNWKHVFYKTPPHEACQNGGNPA